MTPLHSTLKRAVTIHGQDYVITLTPERLHLALKGKRNGIDLAWAELVNGEAALAVALRASVGAIRSTAQRPGDSASAKLPRLAAPGSAARKKRSNPARTGRRLTDRSNR
jgi:hypothetical protein